ncbi:hypothetical protein B0H16DRAFT_1777822 [Mycena metata]|uniref:Uncharacterized protein n=1 Tax=Mycena metata TaxID=1033252 RepID=A0AAD7MR72_9AGAR|nr:hypothetical protein B0H16DRAFT_1777822 [Mycena metata]
MCAGPVLALVLYTSSLPPRFPLSRFFLIQFSLALAVRDTRARADQRVTMDAGDTECLVGPVVCDTRAQGFAADEGFAVDAGGTGCLLVCVWYARAHHCSARRDMSLLLQRMRIREILSDFIPSHPLLPLPIFPPPSPLILRFTDVVFPFPHTAKRAS